MKQRWEMFQEWYDQRVLREQIIIAVVTLLVVYLMMDLLFLQGISKSKQNLSQRFDATSQELTALATEKNVLLEGLKNNPNIARQREFERLADRVEALEKDIAALSAGLVSADKLPQVIRDVVYTHDGVELEGLVAGKPEQLLLQSAEIEKDGIESESIGVYKHPVTFRVSGTYQSLHDYLFALENSEWQFYWDELSFQVQEYPTAVAQVTAYTLSTDEGFIDE